MKKILIIIGLAVITIINSGCPKACIETNYAFSVNSQITLDSDSVHVGDTIFLTSSFSNKLTDQSSGVMIEYSNSTNVGSTLGLVKLIDGIYPGKDAINNFNYISITGSIYNDRTIPSPDKIQQLKYQEVDNYYKLKIGIIPKERGIYYLGVGNGLSKGRNKSNRCEKAGFNITLINTNQHLNYFSDWNPNGTLGIYEKPRAYFLKVY